MTTTTPPDVTYARDLLVSIERGDVSGMSFGFRVTKQEWDESGDILKRKILEVELFDVSPVTYPAYPQTDVALRAAIAATRRRSSRPGLAAKLRSMSSGGGARCSMALRKVIERHAVAEARGAATSCAG
jgi:phage head maturation protease